VAPVAAPIKELLDYMDHQDLSPAELLRRIQDLFRKLGLLGQTLTLDHQGQKYLVGCDAEAFTVYRLVEHCHFPPGAPGWPVCLVTAETIIDETSPPHLPEDEFAAGLSLQEWLELIQTAIARKA
jgi:hypothetical protein